MTTTGRRGSKEKLDRRLDRSAREFGWTVVERTARDETGCVGLTFKRGKDERLAVTVAFVPGSKKSTGSVFWARDEHSELSGTGSVLRRLRSESCPFCSTVRSGGIAPGSLR